MQNKHRFVRLLSVITSSLLAMVSTSVAGPYLLGAPIGADTAPGFTAGLRCRALSPGPHAAISRLAIGASGGLGHPALCSAAETAVETATRVASAAAARLRTVVVDKRRDLYVVHARVGTRGAIELLGDLDVRPDAEVLRIVARELAYPQQLGRGTPLELVYEAAPEPRLAAVRIGKGATARNAFVFHSPSGAGEGFFARDGQALEHRFLRYPLAFDRITSGFSSARQHPILGRRRPHYGVDFAAKPGTPVLAVGAGTVRKARWDNAFGRNVEIVHEDGYVSRYSHLQGYATTVRAGTKVRKGQVIGYVGTTGLTTGPHLHFALMKNGTYLDPLGRNLPKRAPLDATASREFRATVARVESALLAAQHHATATVAQAPASRSDRRDG